ncbi:MAG TPA: T9SS type A sorting domain-containing protein [Candidatus Cloacimonadota bacterium]|nr:T9SS type A sorting domain-containing protein [Candidatus Cloacimonadota bacterium]
MKKIVLLAAIIMLVSILSAQEINLWHNFRYSGKTPTNVYHLQWEGLSTPFTSLNMIYKKNNQLQTVQVDNPDGLNYYACVPEPDADAPCIALSTQTDYFGILSPLKLANNNFVRSIMVEASTDSLYENSNNGDNTIDLKSFHFAYSNDQLAAGMVNIVGNYPNYGTILGPYYAYGVGLLNPENIADSTVYALINANVIGVVTPGLYKLNAGGIDDIQNIDLSDIQNVGSITVTTNNNMLIMKCDWNTLLNDPNFGSWPSYSKSLIMVPFIAKIPSLSDLTPVIDVGTPAVINFTDLSFNMSDNTPPFLYQPEVIANGGNTEVKISYVDYQYQYPIIAKFVIGDIEYEMIPNSHDFHEAVVFSTIIPNNSWVRGECAFSDDSLHVVNYQIDNNVGTNDCVEIEKSFVIYPNPMKPSDQFMKIENYSADPLRRISIYNIKGQKIKEIKPQKGEHIHKISIKDLTGKSLSDGIYFVRGEYDKNMIVKKVLLLK